jgi:O-antigen/teichoic acid export membrane protein
MALALVVYLYRKNELHFRPHSKPLSKELRAEMQYVAFFSIITGLSSLLISSLDKFIVNDMLGLAPAGVFAVATYFGSIIQIPARSIARITSSVIADAWKREDLHEIKTVYHKTCLNQSIIGLGLFLLILVNLSNIIGLMPADYQNAGYVILFIALGYFIDVATGINGVIIGTSKFFRYDTVFMLILVVVTVTSNILLIPLYGITGAAIASCITFFLYNLLRFIFIWSKFGLQPYDSHFLRIIATGALSVAAAWIIPLMSNLYLDSILRSLVFCAFYAALTYWWKISPELNATALQLLRRLRG